MIVYAAPKIPPETQARLDTLRRQADGAESRGQLNYASQKRSQARTIYATLGFRPEHLPAWAAERERGPSSTDYESRAWRARVEEREREEALEKEKRDFISAEDDWRTDQELELQPWYQEHGAAFMAYLNEWPQYDTMDLWAALGRLAAAWAIRSGRPLPPFAHPHRPVGVVTFSLRVAARTGAASPAPAGSSKTTLFPELVRERGPPAAFKRRHRAVQHPREGTNAINQERTK